MECKGCDWSGKHINMHLRHNEKCKQLYSEEEILALKKEMKSIRNKTYKEKPDNKIAEQKYNKIYREKPESKVSKPNYNKKYKVKPKSKIAEQKYNKEYREKPECKMMKPNYNKKFKLKPENIVAEQMYNKAYNQKLENKLSKQMYNQVYFGMEENRAKKRVYNTQNNKVYYKQNCNKILSKKRMKSYAKYFLKHFHLELKNSDLRFGQDWHECAKDGRNNCKDYHTENCPCIYCFPSCPRHCHRVDRDTHVACINCSSVCKKIQGINRMKCTQCDTAWCFICSTKVLSQISYAYTHFYLAGYNDIVPGLCPLHDIDNLTGYYCEECDRVLDSMDNETDNFHDDGNDYLCELCEAKFEWPCEVAHHVQEHFHGKALIVMKFSVSAQYDLQSEEENVRNVKIIHEQVSQLNNVIGVSNVRGKDDFFTPPWIFQIVLKDKDSIKEIPFNGFCLKFLDSVDNITEEYAPFVKQVRGGIHMWKSEKVLLLVESPRAQKFPVNLWLSDPCHKPHVKISSQSVNCQKCQQIIQEVPDILNNRIKKSDTNLTLYKCTRYNRYDCGCEAGKSLSGQPLEKYDQNGYYHKIWPKGHSGVRCNLKFFHACDLWKHNEDHNTGNEGRSLVRLCVSQNKEEDKTLSEHIRKALNSDPNVLIVDPQFDNYNNPIDYWGEGSCFDFIVKEKLNPEKYFRNKKPAIVPEGCNYYIKYFPLGAYISKTMIFDSLRRNILLYNHFHKRQQVPEEYPRIESEDIRKHMIKNLLRKISTAQKIGLWKFEEVNGKYKLIGGSLPEISMSENETDGSDGSENNSDEFSDENGMSSKGKDSDDSMSETESESKADDLGGISDQNSASDGSS